MIGNSVFELVIILLLILANGFFAASEIAIVSARKGRLEQAAEHNQGAGIALELAENPNRFLSTVQVGITMISTFAAAFGGASLADGLSMLLGSIPALAPYASTISLLVVVIGISYVSLILGELVPKRLALQNAEGIASRVAPFMRMLSRLAGPVISLLTLSTEAVLRLLGRQNVAETLITEADVLALVREGTEEGTLEEAEQALITNVFTFTERRVRSVMTPRTKMVAVSVDAPFPTILQTIINSGYSRLPVYNGSLDSIVGILHAKALLRVWGQSELIDVRSLLYPPVYVPEAQRAITAFQYLKQQKSTMAIVLDEYGQVAGLISYEDLLEEVVGDLPDERGDSDLTIVKRADGSYLVDGLLPFVDVQEHLDLPPLTGDVQPRDFETVAGFVLTLLGHIPRVGDVVRWQGYTFEVVDMDDRRVDKIMIRPPQQTAQQQTEGVLAQRALTPPLETPSQNAQQEDTGG